MKSNYSNKNVSTVTIDKVQVSYTLKSSSFRSRGLKIPRDSSLGPRRMESVKILREGTRQSESETLTDSEESAEAKAKENLKSKITKSSSKAKSFLSEKTPKAKHCVKGCCEKLFHWLIELFTTCFAWISQCFKSLLNMAMHN